MRRGKSGEVYCHTSDEVRAMVEADGWGKAYLPSYPPDPPEDDFGASIEVAAGVSGHNICFIEAPTVEAVDAILTQLQDVIERH
jgi:hypothetical protein